MRNVKAANKTKREEKNSDAIDPRKTIRLSPIITDLLVASEMWSSSRTGNDPERRANPHGILKEEEGRDTEVRRRFLTAERDCEVAKSGSSLRKYYAEELRRWALSPADSS